jgi:signal transduction histidine kinase
LVLYLTLPPAANGLSYFLLTLVILGWVTWASSALARLLKGVGDHLGRLNDALQKNQAELEARVAERTRDLNEAQAQLLHQEKMAAFGLLAAGIAHEVGNPLTSISAIVQVLQKRDYDDYTYAKLTLISGQMQRIRTTLRELIEFSRPASTERSHVALGEVLDEALNIAKYYKRTRGRIKPPPLPPDLPQLYAVRDQLVQVFLNLILNAIDATDRDGTVELGVERCPAGVTVWVRDDGAGIAELDVPRMFQPYFTTKKHGTGLGLFVTRKLVAEHDGAVDFESRAGEGTVFRVTLPLAEPSPHAASFKETVSW